MSNNDFKSGDIAIWNSHDDSWFTKGEKYILREVRLDGTVSVYDNEGDLCDRLLCEFVPVTQAYGPIQTETRRVLKPGVYGIVSVKEVYPFHDGKFTLAIQPCAPNAEELESAAMVLSQLAEFLREEGK